MADISCEPGRIYKYKQGAEEKLEFWVLDNTAHPKTLNLEYFNTTLINTNAL